MKPASERARRLTCDVRRPRSAPPWLLALLVVALTSLAGCRCGEGGDSTDGPLVLYSGRSEALVAPLIDRFRQETGIALRVNYADSGQLASTLLAEGDRSPADVFFSQDADSLALLAERGLLAPLRDEQLARTAVAQRDASGRWVATSGRMRVLAYNPTRVSANALPASVDALTAAEWHGRVGWSPENASFQVFVAAMIELRGADATREWLCAMQSNGTRGYPSNTPLVTAVGRGEIDVGLTNHYYARRIVAEQGANFPVANHYFRNGAAESLMSMSGVGIVATTKRHDAASRLVDFLLSDDSQRWFASETGEFPVVSSVRNDDLPPVEELSPAVVEFGDTEDLRTAIALLRECGALR